ncbi:protein FAM205A-like [Ochotona curzoniae]|uniref:protein FAM205A-like n=1 Tax=Ochotona curzoniae TaxID=130825 RepID=UPI001B34C303|nr:protein FAM205A-like [Ochotona curzoniae]
MLNPTFSLWDVGYPLYSYGSIFILILLIWQVKRNQRGLSLESKRSCCQRHRKVRQRARDAASRARRLSQEEAEKPRELISVMKSQGWLPEEENVRRLLCADRSCHICNSVALEIHQLLEGENIQASPTTLGPPQVSPCLEIQSTSNVSLELHQELHSEHSEELSLVSIIPTVIQVTDPEYLPQSAARSPSTVDIQEHWADFDFLQLEEEFEMPDMILDPETMASSVLEEPGFPEKQEEIIENTSSLVTEEEEFQHLKSQASLLSLNTEATHLTHPMAFHIDAVLTDDLPFLNPNILRLLEVHVKKWVHFQRWGLPRRVEESLRQLMPNTTLFWQPGKNESFSYVLDNASKISIEKKSTVYHQTWGSYMTGQPIQKFWVSEWSIMDLKQNHHCQKNQTHVALASYTAATTDPSGQCSLSKGQTCDSESYQQQKYSQLFCGLPSLHSESLVSTLLGSPGISKNENQSKPSLKDPSVFKELSLLPLMPKTPTQPDESTSPPSSNWVSPSDHQQAQIHVPFLTLAEYETLEWHLLQRQLQLQWGLPAAFRKSQHPHSTMQQDPYGKARSLEAVKTSWSGKPVSVLTRELLFFPEHARRMLEFHLQKQVIHHRWGPPQKIQQSIQLLLSSIEQPVLAWSSEELPNESRPQATALETNRDSDLLSPTVTPILTPKPHLFTEAKALLQNHITSKCIQIQQGKVPARVYSSWSCRIPGGLAVVPFSCIPEVQTLELQEATDPDPHYEVVSWMPTVLDQQEQALPHAVPKRHKMPQALSEEAIEKLETTLRHKYLAFLSGLPALYYVALCRAITPLINNQPIITEAVSGSTKSLTEAPTQMISFQEQHLSIESGFQDDNKMPIDNAEELQTEQQTEGTMEMVLPENQTQPDNPDPPKTHILTKLNFHLRKKVLEIQLGIPIRARVSREENIANVENMSSQESPENVNNQEEALPQKPATRPSCPLALQPEWVLFKEQLATELKAIQQSQKQPTSKEVPHGAANWASTISQPSGDTTQAQVLHVQVETSENNPSLEEAWSPEPQSPGKSKDSAPLLTLAKKKEDPGQLRGAGDQGEGDAGLGPSVAQEERLPVEEQRPAGMPLKRTLRGSRRHSQSFHLADLCQHKPQNHPQLKPPEPPPGSPGRKASGNGLQDSRVKLNVPLQPPKILENVQPMVAWASHGQPSQGQLLQAKFSQGHAWPSQLFHDQVRPAHPHKRPSPPDSNLINKMKSFLHSFNPKTKGSVCLESTFCAAEKAAKSRKENAEKRQAPAKRPTKRSKTEKPAAHPKVQSSPTEKLLGPALLRIPHSPDNKLRFRSQQQGSAPVSAFPRHCPRHCPRMVRATQPGNAS